MNSSLTSIDLRKENSDKPGAKVVLTASAIEMSDFFNSQFFAFVGGFSKDPVPA